METSEKNILNQILHTRLQGYAEAPEAFKEYVSETASLTFECFKNNAELVNWFDGWLKTVQEKLLHHSSRPLASEENKKANFAPGDASGKKPDNVDHLGKDMNGNGVPILDHLNLQKVVEEYGYELMKSILDRWNTKDLTVEEEALLSKLRKSLV